MHDFALTLQFYKRIIHKLSEYRELEGTQKDHGSPTPGSAENHPKGSHHVPESTVQMLLDVCQAWCYDHNTVSSHSVGEQPFLNIQAKQPLTQLYLSSSFHFPLFFLLQTPIFFLSISTISHFIFPCDFPTSFQDKRKPRQVETHCNQSPSRLA